MTEELVGGTGVEPTPETPKAKRKVTRLSWAVVDEMRAKYTAKTHTIKQLAAEYGVDNSTVYVVVTNKRWVKKAE